MLRPRIIPALLISGRRLLKGTRFRNHRYIGDPTNAVRIFNDKEVDELVILDIDATKRGEPDFNLIAEIASEAFMPLCYGGGVSSTAQMERLFAIGIEKICIGSAAPNPGLIKEASNTFGSQSIMVSIDYSRRWLTGLNVRLTSSKSWLKQSPSSFAKWCEDEGAGEILLQSIDHEGLRGGYDITTIQSVSSSVKIPVIANGGANSIHDMKAAINKGGASAAAAGSMFVFQGKLQAVLISYPSPEQISTISNTSLNHETNP